MNDDDHRTLEERVTATVELMKAMTRLSVTDYFAYGTLDIAEDMARVQGFSLESHYAYEKGWEDAFKRVIKWLEMNLAGRRCNVYGDPLD